MPRGDAGDAGYMQRQRIVSDYMLCLPCVHAEIVRFLTEWMPSRLAGALRLLRGSSRAPCVRFSLQARRLSSLLNVLSMNVKTYPRPGFIFGSNLTIYLTTDTSLTSSSAHLSTSPPASLSSHRLPHPVVFTPPQSYERWSPSTLRRSAPLRTHVSLS